MTGLSEGFTDESTARFLGPDFLRGIGLLLLVLTNVPLILTPIRYEQVAGMNPFTGVLIDDVAIGAFLSVPTMMGMGMFVLAMGQSLSQAGESQGHYREALKRLTVVGVVGLIHGLLIWWGDILFYYLVAGMIALHFRKRAPATQIVTGASLMMMPLILTFSDLLARVGGSLQPTAGSLAKVSAGYRGLRDSAAAAYSSSDISQIVTQRFTDWLVYMQDFALVGMPQLVGLFLIGTGIARIRRTGQEVFRSKSVGILIAVCAVAAGTGYLTQLGIQLFAPESIGFASSIAANFQVFSPPLLAVTAFLIILRNEHELRSSLLVRLLAAAGRYSLSIYILTSVACAILAYGLGMYGSISASAAMGIALLLYIAQVVVFALLQRSQRLGPLESMVRTLLKPRNVQSSTL